MSENLIIVPGQEVRDPQFQEYKEFFRASKLRDGLKSYLPKQWSIPPERFGHQFHILYQVGREDTVGEEYSFRVFFRKVNGYNIKQWLNNFHKYFVQKHIAPIGKKEPINVRFCDSNVARHQMDFLVLSMPGRYAEMIIDEYFRELKEHL